MFDEDDDDDGSTSSSRQRAYEDGRDGSTDWLGTDTQQEAAAREKGLQDKYNAEQTHEEMKETLEELKEARKSSDDE